MGRPVNKRYFGSPSTGATPGDNIRITAKLTGESVGDGFIVKQKGTKKFQVTVGSTTQICTVVNKAAGDLADGEMTLSGFTSSTTVRIAKLYNRTARDFSGNRYKWSVVDDSTANYIQLVAI